MGESFLDQLEQLLREWGGDEGEALPETLLAGLHSIEARQALTEVLIELLERWNLHRDNRGELLGLEDFTAVERSGTLPDDAVVLERTGHLLAIYRTLRALYPYAPTARDRWVWRHNRLLDDETPMQLMLAEGIAGMRRVRRLLEQQLSSGGMG